jgi:N-acetyl sugar amidotransferase
MSEKPEAYYGLPQDVQFCKRCVISNQRPASRSEFRHDKTSKTVAIHFDEEGICDACRYHEKKAQTIDWSQREAELKDLCDRYRRTDGRYDCIVPGSGGKDSVMAAHLLKFKYDMHPLTVTWAPHMYTDVGRRNHQSWIDSGFDNILFSPNGRVHQLLTRLAFKNLLHPFQPFILGQKNIGSKFAAMYDVPLVFYGESEAEYGNPIADTQTALRHAKFHVGNNYENMSLGGVSIADLTTKHAVQLNELLPYLPMDPDEFEQKQIQVHYTGYYVSWDPQEAYYFAVEHGDFEANEQRTEGTYSKYNSIDDKSDPYHYYTTLIKFGIGRATYDASQEIRNNKITREEGVALVRKFDQELPTRFLPEMLEYIKMTEDEFHETVDQFRSPHLWTKESGQWKLRHTVYEGESLARANPKKYNPELMINS